MPSPIFISHPPPGFSLLAIVRGAQLTIVGGYRALLDPSLWQAKYYRTAVYALLISIAIQFLLWMPLFLLRTTLFFASLFSTQGREHFYSIVDSIDFIQNHILNISQFTLGLVRFLGPECDNIFMNSLSFIDDMNRNKHPDRNYVGYYDRLSQYNKENSWNTAASVWTRWKQSIGLSPALSEGPRPPVQKETEENSSQHEPVDNKTNNDKSSTPAASGDDIEKEKRYFGGIFSFIPDIRPDILTKSSFLDFVSRWIYTTLLKGTLYATSFIPIVGQFVLPAVSAYSIQQSTGIVPASFLFIFGLSVTRRTLLQTLSAYWASRALTRDLLQPYFTRLPYTSHERKAWFRAREGVLFGFGLGFYFLLRIPFIGVLVYGFAEASTAYLVTKITEPPPTPDRIVGWTESHIAWTNENSLIGNGQDLLSILFSLTGNGENSSFKDAAEKNNGYMPGGFSSKERPSSRNRSYSRS